MQRRCAPNGRHANSDGRSEVKRNVTASHFSAREPARSRTRGAARERQSRAVRRNEPGARFRHRLDDGNQGRRSNDRRRDRLDRQESAGEARVFAGNAGAFAVAMRRRARIRGSATSLVTIVRAAVVVQKMHGHRRQQIRRQRNSRPTCSDSPHDHRPVPDACAQPRYASTLNYERLIGKRKAQMRTHPKKFREITPPWPAFGQRSVGRRSLRERRQSPASHWALASRRERDKPEPR